MIEYVKDSGFIGNIRIVEKKYDNIAGLPEPEEDVYLIVSFMAMDAGKKIGRTDLLCPDTGPDSVIRDESGRIIGVKRLQR